MIASVVCLGKPASQLLLKNQLEENCPVQLVWARVETVDAATSAIVASNVDKTNLQPARARDVAPRRGPMDDSGRGSHPISASIIRQCQKLETGPPLARSSLRRGGVRNPRAKTPAGTAPAQGKHRQCEHKPRSRRHRLVGLISPQSSNLAPQWPRFAESWIKSTERSAPRRFRRSCGRFTTTLAASCGPSRGRTHRQLEPIMRLVGGYAGRILQGRSQQNFRFSN
jgi:hypothetical protein